MFLEELYSLHVKIQPTMNQEIIVCALEPHPSQQRNWL